MLQIAAIICEMSSMPRRFMSCSIMERSLIGNLIVMVSKVFFCCQLIGGLVFIPYCSGHGSKSSCSGSWPRPCA